MNLISCSKFDRVVTELCDIYNVDLYGDFGEAMDRRQTHFRLKHKDGCFDDLSLELIWENKIAIGHISVLNGYLMYDPEIVFFYDSRSPSEKQFQPISFTNHYVGYYQTFAKPKGKQLTKVNLTQTQDCVVFLETWADNIRDQGWLDRDQVSR